jgi:beta-glucuronidase
VSALRPQRNRYRDWLDLSGLWAIRADPSDAGEALGFSAGFLADAQVAVPGSVNEQLAERGYRDTLGPLWLQREIELPAHAAGHTLTLYLGSADLCARVWLDGVHLGDHEQPFLPFIVEVSTQLHATLSASLVIRLDGRLDAAHPLPGIDVDAYQREGRPRDEVFPPVRYDFFPYLGLHRAPLLAITPRGGLTQVDVAGDFDAERRLGRAHVTLTAAAAGRARLTLRDPTGALCADTALTLVANTAIEAVLAVDHAVPWAIGQGVCYRLQVDFVTSDGVSDRYERLVGFRRVQVVNQQLTLNGAPVTLKGFGMHEDFPIVGKAHLPALAIKDFELLRWIGANSLRTSHYAYAEEILDLADTRGVLVISEVASVNLDFRHVDESTLKRHRAMVDAQIARDRSHPCVIAWSLVNEPGYLAERAYAERAGAYFDALFAHARALDPTRPLTGANVGGRHGDDDPLYARCDFLMLNRYVGWYEAPAQLERALQAVAAELDRLSARYARPMLLSEFGADAIAGQHASVDQLFTEEFQARLIAGYWRLIERHPALIGGHVWNFADFRTAQHHRRVVLNHKGVFTRTRDPKLAAWTLKKLWTGEESFPC